jgi:hypothetical protein
VRVFASLILLALLVLLPGCGSTPDNLPTTVPTTGAVGDPSVQLVMPGFSRAFYLDVYQVVVPFGTVSRNADFWRHVDEEAIDPVTKDLLLKNGMRCGLAANQDWDFFREQIEQNPHLAKSGSAVATGNGQIELPMKQNVPEQTIFYFSGHSAPEGRTYEKCNDLIGVSFWPDHRRIGEMNISLSPTIRSTRSHYEYTMRGDERVLTTVTPEYLYELNLRTAVPMDKFLVIGLSPAGDQPSTLGHNFLTLEGGAELHEQVLIFVPRVPQRRPPAATRPSPATAPTTLPATKATK